jgi:ribosome maturation factor RimP
MMGEQVMETEQQPGTVPPGVDPVDSPTQLADRIEALARPVVSSMGLELVETLCLGGRHPSVVRLIVDKPGGVSHDDCQAVSRVVGTQLDVADLLPHAYTMEVSSPGLDRRLKRAAEYDKYRGRLAKVKTTSQVWTGRLGGLVDDHLVVLQLVDDREVRIPLRDVVMTQLIVEVGTER